MLGLIYKDFCANLKWLCLSSGIILFYSIVMGMADSSSHDIDFSRMRPIYYLLYAFVFIMTGALSLNYVQTDERKKWGYFVASLPNGIVNQVVSKYIFVALTLAFAFGVCWIQNLIVRQFNDEVGSITGIPEFKRNDTIYIPELYATEGDVPEIQAPEVKKFSVTALTPDGKTAYSEDYEIAEGEMLAVPEIENAFISEIIDSEGNSIYGTKVLRYGASRLDTFFDDGESYTIKTVSADSIKIYPGADTVCAYITGENEIPVGGINISVDDIRYVNSDRLTGLSPDTTYTLYYKQGIDGKVYTTTFRTAHEDYGVYIGRQAVTDKNTGDLEKDGWHYDPESKTLTLKDFSIKDTGAVANVDNTSSLKTKTKAVISSQDELTVELIGDNYIEGIYTNGYDPSLIYAKKDLTVKGTGNISLKNGYEAFRSLTGNIYLSSSGKQSFEECTAYNTDKGKVYYENGTIEIDRTRDLLPFSKRDILDLSKKIHSLKITDTDEDGNTTTLSDEEFIEKLKSPFLTDDISITPIHDDSEKILKSVYLESGSCGEGAVYHYACKCGHIGKNTYTVDAHEHKLVHHKAKAADCCNDGWKAYDTCEECGYTTFKAIAAKGHDMILHEALPATCTDSGKLAYWSCKTCGGIFADEQGELPLNEEALTVPAAGHSLKFIAAVPATCNEDGNIEHWRCEECGKLFADSEGLLELTNDEITILHTGHIWGDWFITKEPTTTHEGVEIRTCKLCGEKETRTVPKLTEETTTTTSTTTTTTTTSKPATTSSTSTTTTTTTTKTTSTTSTTSTTTKTTSTTTSTTSTTTKTTSTTTSTTSTTTKTTSTTTSTTSTTTKTTSTTTSTSSTTSTTTTTKTTSSTTSTTSTTTTTTSTTTKKPTTTSTTSTTTSTTTSATSTTSTTTTESTTTETTTTSSGTASNETTTTTTTTEPVSHAGDVNEDGIINAVDASRILVFYAALNAGEVEATEKDMALCDINKDKMINAIDASLVLAYYANLNADPDLTLEAFLADKLNK